MQEAEPIPDVIYTKRDGLALAMDNFKPAQSNGAAIIKIVSGGWKSNLKGIKSFPLWGRMREGSASLISAHAGWRHSKPSMAALPRVGNPSADQMSPSGSLIPGFPWHCSIP